jgi:tetratricopeptide (TPR) repeat protein
MRPAEIASLLDERFRLLTGGRRTAVERHQTLRAAVDWSYSLLGDRERLVFERLGVFAGGFDIAAASEVVVGDGVERWDVVDAIGELVAKSMIVADDRPTDTTRYQMLETLRAYARERLDEMGDPDSWRRRHAEHFATVAEHARPELRGVDELGCRERLRDELDNLRTAVGWALDRDGDDVELGLRIIAALACESYMDRSSGVGAWALRAAPLAEHTGPGRRTAVLAAASMDALLGGDYVTGRSLGEQALRDGLPTDCPALHVAHLAIAECDTFSGNHARALEVMAEARRAVDDVGGDTYSLASIDAADAAFTAMSGDFGRARPMAEEAVRLTRSLGNPSILAVSLFALGFALWDEDPIEALAALDESVALARAGASDMVLAAALSLAARVRARGGDAPAALRGLRDALSAADDVGDRPTFFSALDRAIEILVSAGELDRAAVITGVVTRGPFREMTSLQGGPEEQARARVIEELRGRLGAPRFDAAVERGAALSYDEVIDYSVGELDALLAEGAASA